MIISAACGSRRTRAARVACVLIGLALSSAWLATPADAQTQKLEAGDVTVVLAPRRPGMRVLCGGIEVIKHSEMVVTRPPWAPHYYLGPAEPAVSEATRGRVDGGDVLRIEHRGNNDSFVATETLTLHNDGRLEQVLEGELLQEAAEALIQWRIGAINPVILVGRPYSAVMSDGSTRQGTVPVTASSPDVGESTLARDFRSVEFDSRIGRVRIDVDTEHTLVLYDNRMNRWASPDDPYFWFGDLGTRFRTGDRIRYRVVYHLPEPTAMTAANQVVSAAATVHPLPDAQTYPQPSPPLVIPRPKEATYRDDGVALSAPLRIGRSEDAVEADGALHLLRAALKRGFGVETADDHASAQVVFTRAPSGTVPGEGYRLETNGETVTIAAADRRGFAHGVHTLCQLVTRRPDGTPIVRGAKIRDWPTLGFRGIHMFTGGQGPDLHLELIRNILGPLKLNHLVLECEYIEWESHPEIHHPRYGMPKDEVRQILAACNDYGIEVTPLVMALGHCQWIFETGHHLDLAEDPEAKWAYCVTNPQTYEFIFAIYEEALELFKPRWFHIGHDEYTDRGRVPYRESSKPFTVEELFMMDTLRLHGWLKERGVRTMMWGDMLLAKGEGPDACNARSKESAAELREKLPDDVLIADWHYCGNPPADFINLDVFHNAGHETVAATWDRPNNIVNFARAAHDKGSLGLLQTTWAGYSLDQQSFAREMHQYAAYVLAAEAAWNADSPPDPDAYPAKSYFLDLMGMSTLKPANAAGWVADLSAAFNYPLAAGDKSGWFGLGPEHDLAGVPGGEVRFKGLMFQLGSPGEPGQPSGIVLRSKLACDPELPSEVRIGLDARAARLAVLHTTSFSCDVGATVGQYQLAYEDDATATIDLVYGQNVMAYNDPTAAPAAPIVWSGETAAGQTVALRALIWDNPHPRKKVRSLAIRSADAAGSLIVLGVTGLEAPSAARHNAPR